MRVPYVPIELPLAASSGGPFCLVRLSKPVAGRMLTSAPVSTRNCRFVTVSQRKRRPLLWPAAEATTGGRPARFPTRRRVVCIGELPLQICDGNNTVYLERKRGS